MDSVPNREYHGASRTPEYKIWKGIVTRCYNPNATDYPDYGGRGIKVSDEWRHSFSTFLRDMGKRPTPRHSVDRIRNDGPYSAENCRWATPQEQHRNTSYNRMLTYAGETLPVAEWAERIGMNYWTLIRRVQLGWTDEDAITRPTRQWGTKQEILERRREIHRLFALGWSKAAIAREVGLTRNGVIHHLQTPIEPNSS